MIIILVQLIVKKTTIEVQLVNFINVILIFFIIIIIIINSGGQ